MAEANWNPISGYETQWRLVNSGGGSRKVAAGDKVVVHAKGYEAGVGKVITGWDQGCLGMGEGDIRELIIPAKEGYGEGGFPHWGIPPGGILNFTIEVLKIKGDQWQKIDGVDTKIMPMKAGSGKTVQRGSRVTVHAKGEIWNDGDLTKFWNTKDQGQQAFTYEAGVGGVIKGWDEGCLGMKEGEVRKILIPHHEGYGKRGFPAWNIPPRATLHFTIEVLKVH